MDLPPSSHFIYIPVILVLGLVLGFIMGARSTREAIRLQDERAQARERRKAERAQNAATTKTTASNSTDPGVAPTTSPPPKESA